MIRTSLESGPKDRRCLLRILRANASYLDLKEEAVTMATKIKTLQGSVEMLEYAEGADEVQGFMSELLLELKQGKMTRLGGQEGLKQLLN